MPPDPEMRYASEPLLDLRQTRELLAYIRASMSRHRWRILLTTLVTTALTLPLLALMPKTYTTSAAVTAKPESIMPALAHPGRSLPFYADNPGALAPEMSLRDERLRELIHRIDLKKSFHERRPPLLAFKDAVLTWIEPMTDEDFEKILMGAVEQNVDVVSNQGVVTIKGTWRDPVTAAELVDTLLNMFIEDRRRLEVEPIKETVRLLEREVERSTQQVDDALDDVKSLRSALSAWNQRQARALRQEMDAVRAQQQRKSREVAALQTQLVAKRRAIDELEGVRSQKLMDLRAQLAMAETRLGERHPERVALVSQLKVLERESPELNRLRGEEDVLSMEIANVMSREQRQQDPDGTVTTQARTGDWEGPRSDEDEAVSQKRQELLNLVAQSQDLKERLLGAQLEQRVAEDAFRFRYLVLRQADPPRKPDNPKEVKILVSAAISGLLLGIFFGLSRDVLSGRVFHAWQVHRQLGLRLLGEVNLS